MDRETVTRLAAQARLVLRDEDIDAHVERLKGLAAWIDEWAGEPLPFRFHDGEFTYTPVLAQYRPQWRPERGADREQ